ncbi:MAG TPA: hypothetical protein PK228_08565 [Saprospiraceae bacterium]|nr:hypothetical protein [Saprospiraceae bacterium]
MAHSKCPQCLDDGFSWYVDAEPPCFTRWYCHKCAYSAVEDESYEQKCPCGESRVIQITDDSETGVTNESHLLKYEPTVIRLVDDSAAYWWCSSCVKRFQIPVIQ